MIVGLLFAISEAEGRPGVLAATLPFGASSLLEYQARLLQNCGATHLIVVVERLTPELLAATARLTRRGLTVDTARSAADVLARAHPLARVLMIADALVTTDNVVSWVADSGSDALLAVSPDVSVGTGLERLGGGMRWGGVAQLEHARLVEAAGLPPDYDLQSTLLRVAEQAGAHHVPLAAADPRAEHGVERRPDVLETRGRAMLASTVPAGPGWVERVLVRPLAGRMIPLLARRGVTSRAAALASGVVSLLGLLLMGAGYVAPGLVPVLLGVVLLDVVAVLARSRDEAGLARMMRTAGAAIAAVAVVLVAWKQDSALALVLAAAALANAALAMQAASGARHPPLWWMTEAAGLAVLVVVTVAGQPLAALALIAVYATATLASAIDALRGQA